MANLKSLIFPITLIVLMIGPDLLAQESNEKSRKIDDFLGEVDYEDLISRLDNFAVALQKQPNADAHIIVYRSRRDTPAISGRYGLKARDYLVKARGIDRSRVVTVDGGMSGCLMYELWIVPRGALPPERRFTYTFPLKSRTDTRRRR